MLMLARLIALALILPFALPARAEPVEPALKSAVDAPLRSEKNRVRDPYRHPAEALSFFGVRPDSVVVEIMPGGAGYWTEILAPYLKDKGRYIAANAEPTSDEAKRETEGFAAKVAADAADYGKVEQSVFGADRHAIAAPESADFVLTFRNLHNWMKSGDAEPSLKAFYAALKHGGVLGIEDHRGIDTAPQDPLAKSGYVRQDYAIKLIEGVGFKFAGASEISANPKDTKDYSVGVWALPPTYRLKDVDHSKYQAIGESDRFTLKFVKP
jgi:predicted methyltransferase